MALFVCYSYCSLVLLCFCWWVPWCLLISGLIFIISFSYKCRVEGCCHICCAHHKPFPPPPLLRPTLLFLFVPEWWLVQIYKLREVVCCCEFASPVLSCFDFTFVCLLVFLTRDYFIYLSICYFIFPLHTMLISRPCFRTLICMASFTNLFPPRCRVLFLIFIYPLLPAKFKV